MIYLWCLWSSQSLSSFFLQYTPRNDIVKKDFIVKLAKTLSWHNSQGLSFDCDVTTHKAYPMKSLLLFGCLKLLLSALYTINHVVYGFYLRYLSIGKMHFIRMLSKAKFNNMMPCIYVCGGLALVLIVSFLEDGRLHAWVNTVYNNNNNS